MALDDPTLPSRLMDLKDRKVREIAHDHAMLVNALVDLRDMLNTKGLDYSPIRHAAIWSRIWEAADIPQPVWL